MVKTLSRIILCNIYISFLPPLATGILKGYDQLLNLVLDNTVEYMRGKPVAMTTGMPITITLWTDPDDQFKILDETRKLGLVVCRGTAVVLLCPADTMEAIPNPFIQET